MTGIGVVVNDGSVSVSLWPYISWHIWPAPEVDSEMAAQLHCMLMMCMKLRNLHIHCSVPCADFSNLICAALVVAHCNI